MTLTEFISKYNGQTNVGNTTDNKGQCVGLVMVWLVDTLKNPHIWGHAKDLMVNADKSAYDVIPNTLDGVPQAGDVICWNGRMGGGYGHTAIVVKADLTTIEVFEQNTNPLSCHLATYKNYNNVQGWIRPKKTVQMATITQEELDSIRTRRDELYNENVTLNTTINELKTKLEEEQKKSQGLRKSLDELTELDVDLAEQKYDVEKERDNYKNIVESVASILHTAPELKPILEALDGLTASIEEQVKPLQKHALTLQEVLDDFIYVRIPKSKPLIERLILWLKKHLGI